MHMWERLHVAAAANSCRVHALDPCGCMPVAPWAALLGLLEESCEREVLRPRMGENRLMPVCSAEKLNHSAPCCSVRLLVWFFLGAHKKKKKRILVPAVARGLYLDSIHSALQVIFCGGCCWRERGEIQPDYYTPRTWERGPFSLVPSVVPLRGLFSSPGSVLISQKLMGIEFAHPKLCFLLTDEYLLIFSAICVAKLCSNILIIIWSWLAYTYTVSLKHMGTFQRLY